MRFDVTKKLIPEKQKIDAKKRIAPHFLSPTKRGDKSVSEAKIRPRIVQHVPRDCLGVYMYIYFFSYYTNDIFAESASDYTNPHTPLSACSESSRDSSDFSNYDSPVSRRCCGTRAKKGKEKEKTKQL